MTEKTTKTAIPLLGQLAHVHLESNSLQLAVIINFIVPFFYPFDTDGPAPDPGTHLSGLCLVQLVHVN